MQTSRPPRPQGPAHLGPPTGVPPTGVERGGLGLGLFNEECACAQGAIVKVLLHRRRPANLSPLPDHILVRAEGGGRGAWGGGTGQATEPCSSLGQTSENEMPEMRSEQAQVRLPRGGTGAQGRCRNRYWCNHHPRVCAPYARVCAHRQSSLPRVCHTHSQYLPLCPRASLGGRLVPWAGRRGKGWVTLRPTPVALG